jgi:acetylornithine/succinyldiaminopimelate/putrescine aminotransferase
MATLSATGQDKVKIGFEPLVEAFTHVPFNDLQALNEARKKDTVAVLIEGIQGEGGVNVARAEYLLGVRAFCREHDLLLLWDGVQCGMFRTGCFQSYERILEETENDFLPDGIAMAKSLGGGFPIGAVWVRDPLHQLMNPGSHGTTYGGNPMACAASLAVFDSIEKLHLEKNIRECGEHLKAGISELIKEDDSVITAVRGYGGLLGIELREANARAEVQRLINFGLLTVAAGDRVIRLLPPLNVKREECDEALNIIKSALFLK